MTQLGSPVPDAVAEIRRHLTELLLRHDIAVIDADSVVTGRDFLLKIWNLILAVPLGVAILHEKMRHQTRSNIFYELGVLQAYGKEILVVKTKAAKIPSDFVRTEYVNYDDHFDRRIHSFIDTFFKLAEHYENIADQVERNPLLAIDYLRRAYLISGKEDLRSKVQTIMEAAALEGRAKNSVEMLLANF